MNVTPVGRALGAVVEDVALDRVDDEGFAAIHRALLEHQVLFFRDQHLREEDHLALAARWGTPMPHPVGQLLGEDQVIGRVEDTPDSPPNADAWHTDITYWPEPPKLAVLCALDVPDAGGDTMWSSLYAVYDALSAPVRQLCESLEALHAPSAHFVRAYSQHHGAAYAELIERNLAGAVLPLVRTHDETGRHALFFSGGMRLLGLEAAESELLVQHLHRLVDDHHRTVRWRWQAGDVAIWDERCTNHRALADHFPAYRLMRRCTVEGPRPFFRPDGEEVPRFTARSVEAPLVPA